MNIFDMGIMEIVVILIVAILIFGPGRIPEIAQKMGRGLRAFRKITTDMTKEFTKALDAEDKASSSKEKGGDKIGQALDKIEAGSDQIGKSLGKFLGESGKKDG